MLTILTIEKRSEENIWKMDLASLAHAIFLFQILETSQEDLSRNGLMSLEVGLNIVSQRTKHIAFVVSYSEKRRMQDMNHLLLMVGMVIIGKEG
jgi:hypothetical protein